MDTLQLYPQPLYKGETSRWYRRSPRHTLLYAENGKVRVEATIPSAGNPGKRGKGARIEVLIEFGVDDLLEVMVEAEKQEKEAAESNDAAESLEEPFAPLEYATKRAQQPVEGCGPGGAE